MIRKIIVLLFCALVLCGCDELSGSGLSKADRINEALLADVSEDSYKPLPVSVRKETGSVREDGTYLITYYDINDNVIKMEFYDASDGMLINTGTFYDKKDGQKVVTEYNPEYYESHCEPGFPVYFLVSDVWYYGKMTNSTKTPIMGTCPSFRQWRDSDGCWGTEYYPLDEYCESYLDTIREYDAQDNLIRVWYGDPEHGAYTKVRMEYYEYKNGQMTRMVECDLIEKTAVCTDYKNGEPVKTENWIIDEYGNRVNK